MPDEISVVKLFANMVTEDENLLVKFLRLYIEECEKLEQEHPHI